MTRPMGEPSTLHRLSRVQAATRQLQRRPAPEIPAQDPGVAAPPTAICTGDGFTATDGAYYGLAQTTGADPSAFGVASQIWVYNDPGDATKMFRVKPVSTGYVLQFFLTDPFSVGNRLKISYEGGVLLTGPFSGGPTAQLYLGTGVGSSTYSYESVVAYEARSGGRDALMISGLIDFPAASFDPFTNGLVNLPTLSPILLCEGADIEIDRTWFRISLDGLLDIDSAVLFQP